MNVDLQEAKIKQLERDLAAVTKERDALRVHCTIADHTLDEMYGLTTRLGEAAARIKRLEEAFAELEKCDFNPENCASLEVASARIRKFATQAKEAR
jgi:predicted RNase H-like nuclease (RuvC/YqgF family)